MAIDRILANLLQCTTPTESEVEHICTVAKDIFIAESNVLYLKSPITICGDIHGQLFDLLELFKIGGMPPDCKYLFMGDFVDRGLFSVEVVCILLCLKIKFPECVFLTRGNHESRQITQVYGFYDEVLRKYGVISVWRLLTDLFDYLPLSAVVDQKIFCCHGGLSPSIESIDDIQRLNRRQEIPYSGAMCDLLWSDPDLTKGFGASPRGAGFTFGQDRSEEFCAHNKLELLCRAHQLMMEGHEFVHAGKVVTVFSAPNYCGRCGNKASLMEVNGDVCEITDFVSGPQQPEKEDRVPDFFL